MAADDYLTVQEAARELRMTNVTVIRWIKSGRLRASQATKHSHYRIKRSDFEEMLSTISRSAVEDDPWGTEPPPGGGLEE